MNPRHLYRSRSDRAIAGIAGGMADYLEVDPTIVRILWVLAAIFSGGLVVILYIILAFVIPMDPYEGGPIPPGVRAAGTTPSWSPDWATRRETGRAPRAERPGRAGLIIGTVLIVFGVIALADVVIPGWIGGALVGPALLLAIGAALLVASLRRNDAAAAAAPPAPPAATAGSESDITTTVPIHPESDPS